MISLVIPTLGGDALDATIAAVNAGTVVPDEILVCIPEAEAARLRPLHGANVVVVATPCRGQVAQRAVGFQRASGDLVMQLDDDLIVARDCVERLCATLEVLPPKSAVSPALVDRATGQSVYHRPSRAGVTDRLYGFLMNGRKGLQPGCVARTGAAPGIDPLQGGPDVQQVEWLPGGCVMHRRANLVMEPFYPFPGKAYCEDIIHSHYLTSRGVGLHIDGRARCSVDVPSGPLPLPEFWKEMRADLRARRHFMRLSGRAPAQVYRFLLARGLGYASERMAGAREEGR